jgi:hypothetical protein
MPRRTCATPGTHSMVRRFFSRVTPSANMNTVSSVDASWAQHHTLIAGGWARTRHPHRVGRRGFLSMCQSLCRRPGDSYSCVCEWLLLRHLIGVAFLVAGFAIYVANLDRLPGAKTVADITPLTVVAVGERVRILGGVLLIPSALIMATQHWSLSRAGSRHPLRLSWPKGSQGRGSVPTYGNSTPSSLTSAARRT